MQILWQFQTVFCEITYQRINTLGRAMKVSTHQQVKFSNRHPLKRVESTNRTYNYETTLLRFTKQAIEIAKVDGINVYEEKTISILQQIERKAPSEYFRQDYIIYHKFFQRDKIYLIIRVRQNCFLGQITLPTPTLDMDYILSQIFRIQNPHILDKMIDKSVISHKMFLQESEPCKMALILMKDQQNDAFALLKGTVKDGVLFFSQEHFKYKDLECQLMFDSVLFTKSHFAFIYTCGKIKVFEISKKSEYFQQKNALKVKINDQIRSKGQINNINQYKLVSTCQTHQNVHFLFALNATDSRYVLLRWKKDADFSNMKNFAKYSFPNPFKNSDLTYLSCLRQQQGRCVMVIFQSRPYFLLQMNTVVMSTKVRRLQTDQIDAHFGLCEGLLCLFERQSYSEALFQVDSETKCMKFSSSSKDNKEGMSNKQQNVILKSTSDFQKIHLQGEKGNNRLSSSDHNIAAECLSQEQVQRQDQVIKNPYENQAPQQSFPSFPLSLHQNHNIPYIPQGDSQTNPLTILSNHRSILSGNIGNFVSFNQNPIVNIQNEPPIAVTQAGGYMSFGVAPLSPIQQVTEPIYEPAQQIPTFNRGFSFGDDKVAERPVIRPKQPVVRQRNINSLHILRAQMKDFQINLQNQVKAIKQIGHQASKCLMQEVFSNNHRRVSISKNTRFWFNSRYSTCQKRINALRNQFQASYQKISNNINKKVHQLGLNNKKQSFNSKLTQQPYKKNEKTVHKSIVSFKLKLNRLSQEAQRLQKCISNLQKKQDSQSKQDRPQKKQ